MNNEDITPIILPLTYSSTRDHTPLINDYLLKLMDKRGCVIYGPTLFTLKYGVLPCTAKERSYAPVGDNIDAYNFNMTGQFFDCERGEQWCSERKQRGMYHAMRFLIYFQAVFHDIN